MRPTRHDRSWAIRNAPVLAALLSFAGCGSSEDREPAVVVLSASQAPSATAATSHAAPRVSSSVSRGKDLCLPVVAAECGCVYTCGVGHEDSPGRYSVEHPFWREPLQAKVDQWCSDGECTRAFFADIVCDGICGPRPADATCHFDGDRCVGALPHD
ncbi:MAG: hypothetical protein U0271_00955 [Polyangiaceae bacterium]